VPATTLRYWEDLGLLPPQERSGGQRRYDPDALRRVMLTLPPIDWCTD
jgi:DNA-binding transcriptional MerR regulator